MSETGPSRDKTSEVSDDVCDTSLPRREINSQNEGETLVRPNNHIFTDTSYTFVEKTSEVKISSDDSDSPKYRAIEIEAGTSLWATDIFTKSDFSSENLEYPSLDDITLPRQYTQDTCKQDDVQKVNNVTETLFEYDTQRFPPERAIEQVLPFTKENQDIICPTCGKNMSDPPVHSSETGSSNKTCLTSLTKGKDSEVSEEVSDASLPTCKMNDQNEGETLVRQENNIFTDISNTFVEKTSEVGIATSETSAKDSDSSRYRETSMWMTDAFTKSTFYSENLEYSLLDDITLGKTWQTCKQGDVQKVNNVTETVFDCDFQSLPPARDIEQVLPFTKENQDIICLTCGKDMSDTFVHSSETGSSNKTCLTSLTKGKDSEVSEEVSDACLPTCKINGQNEGKTLVRQENHMFTDMPNTFVEETSKVGIATPETSAEDSDSSRCRETSICMTDTFTKSTFSSKNLEYLLLDDITPGEYFWETCKLGGVQNVNNVTETRFECDFQSLPPERDTEQVFPFTKENQDIICRTCGKDMSEAPVHSSETGSSNKTCLTFLTKDKNFEVPEEISDASLPTCKMNGQNESETLVRELIFTDMSNSSVDKKSEMEISKSVDVPFPVLSEEYNMGPDDFIWDISKFRNIEETPFKIKVVFVKDSKCFVLHRNIEDLLSLQQDDLETERRNTDTCSQNERNENLIIPNLEEEEEEEEVKGKEPSTLSNQSEISSSLNRSVNELKEKVVDDEYVENIAPRKEISIVPDLSKPSTSKNNINFEPSTSGQAKTLSRSRKPKWKKHIFTKKENSDGRNKDSEIDTEEDVFVPKKKKRSPWKKFKGFFSVNKSKKKAEKRK